MGKQNGVEIRANREVLEERTREKRREIDRQVRKKGEMRRD